MSLLQIDDKADYTVIKCPAKLDPVVGQELLKCAQNWVKAPPRLYVLDFNGVVELQAAVYRTFVLLNQALKKNGSFFATINTPDIIHQQIKAGGLEAVLFPRPTLEDAMLSAGLKVQKVSVDRELVEPFIQAVKITLEVQANTKLEVGESYFRKQGEELSCAVAATMSLTSRRHNGMVALLFPAKVFLLIYGNMLMDIQEVVTREMSDAAGELLNMIFGQAKAELNDKGDYDVQRAIPTVVQGEDVRIVHHLSRNPILVTPFKTDAGTFYLEVSMEPV